MILILESLPGRRLGLGIGYFVLKRQPFHIYLCMSHYYLSYLQHPPRPIYYYLPRLVKGWSIHNFKVFAFCQICYPYKYKLL